MSSAPTSQSDADQLEAAADQAIAACGGDAREAFMAMGYARGKLFEAAKTLPRDRKDWYD
jgi:hypothetical protein